MSSKTKITIGSIAFEALTIWAHPRSKENFLRAVRLRACIKHLEKVIFSIIRALMKFVLRLLIFNPGFTIQFDYLQMRFCELKEFPLAA